MRAVTKAMFHVKHRAATLMGASDLTHLFHVKHFPQRLCPALSSAMLLAALMLNASVAVALPAGADTQPDNVLWLYALLAALPVLLIAATSFVKVVVVLSLLRSAIGVPQVPSNAVITTIGIVLSIFIMAPIAENVMTSIEPQIASSASTTPQEVWQLINSPTTGVTAFLERHSDTTDIKALQELGLKLRANDPEATPPTGIILLAPAFLLSELKEAFIIGVILFLPFVVLDLVVVNILMSLGLHALNPNTISIPAKLLLFVVVDGWFLLLKGLILGYAP
jgi:type III secretion protein R